MNNETTPSAPPAPDYASADISAWGFAPGSNRDKHGVLYSKDRKTLIWGVRATGRYEIAPTVIKIKKGAFCESAIFELFIPPGVKVIPEWMCKDCISLRHVELPHGALVIRKQAFEGCTSLSQIVIPAGVKSIHCRAFYGCDALRTVDIPHDCEAEIGAFPRGCRLLTPEEGAAHRHQLVMEKYGNPELETVGMARQGNP